MQLRSTLSRIPRLWKRAILLVFDFCALAFAVWAAYLLRMGEFSAPNLDQLALIVLAPILAIPVFIRFGLYRSVIRYLSERAFWTIANAVVIGTLLWILALFLFEISRHGGMPRSVPAIYCMLAIFIIGGSRFAIKYILWTPAPNLFSAPVAIYGAGAAGSQLANALAREGNRYVAGFIDDDTALQGRDVAGIRVYAPNQLPQLMNSQGVSEVIISIPSIDTALRQNIVANLSQHRVKIRTLPAIADLAAGRYLISQIREINIDDVLGRSSVPAEPELLKEMIRGRAILISGAGGSIGSELCRLIAKWEPRAIVLLEANEFALYQIERTLKGRTDAPVIPVLGSVADDALVRRTLRTHAVQVVFHAAAHKHVPMVEANALEGIRNNVFGTQTIAKAAFDLGVQDFVLISTDKAVRPPNVMGATKRWAELIVHTYAKRSRKNATGQKFSAVRFGNVLGSNGSVVPLFKEQIAAGGPITVTDSEMTRYFMSIHEAAELIVQAGALAEGGDIFLLDMGEPVRISDLAENMIRLAGLSIRNAKNPQGDIAISIIGRRPAEKTHEELFYDPSSAIPTRQAKILRARNSAEIGQNLDAQLLELQEFLKAEDEISARQLLFNFVHKNDLSSARTNVLPLVKTEDRR